MPFSPLSSLTNRVPTDKIRFRVLTWLIRLLTGGVFLFSGFTKAIDPWGTLYKIREYLTAMGFDWGHSLIVVVTFALCSVEFIVGAMLVFGSFRRSAAWIAMAIMCFMLPLTLWIAVVDPVADCGCFGDAYIISNWSTFWKNVVLFIFCVWLCLFNRKAGWLITPALQWIGLVATGGFVLAISLVGYIYQPLLDFRPYKIGGPLIEPLSSSAAGEESDDGSDSGEFAFIYEKDGRQHQFGIDDELPDEDEGWKFVKRIALSGNEADNEVNSSDSPDFRIWNQYGEDVTLHELAPFGRTLLLLMPELGDVSIATTWKLNSLYSWAQKNNVRMLAVVAGSQKEIDEWKDLSMPEYPIFTAEDTQIKELVRGNPALVYIEEGKILWKSSLQAMVTDDFLDETWGSSPRNFTLDNRRILSNITSVYLIVMGILISLSFLPRIRFRNRRKESVTTHDDTALPEE